MPLNKTDLTQIKEVVTEVVTTEIAKSEKRTDVKLDALEEKIITILTREVVDLADAIRLVLDKTNQIDNHEQRITRLETKAVRRGR